MFEPAILLWYSVLLDFEKSRTRYFQYLWTCDRGSSYSSYSAPTSDTSFAKDHIVQDPIPDAMVGATFTHFNYTWHSVVRVPDFTWVKNICNNIMYSKSTTNYWSTRVELPRFTAGVNVYAFELFSGGAHGCSWRGKAFPDLQRLGGVLIISLACTVFSHSCTFTIIVYTRVLAKVLE